MARKYFGTDGIRGRVGQSVINPDFALRLAHAVGQPMAHGQHGARARRNRDKDTCRKKGQPRMKIHLAV